MARSKKNKWRQELSGSLRNGEEVALDSGTTEQLDLIPQPGGRLTGATVEYVLERLLEGGLLFKLDDAKITRHFVSYFFEGSVWKVELSVLRETVAKLYGCPDNVPVDPNAFTTWVRREILGLDALPRDKLVEIYQWASEDLSAVLENIEYCKKKLVELERRDPKSDGDNADVGFHRYFLAMNNEARDEIVDVLAHRIQYEALRASYRSFGRMGCDFHVPWAFRWLPSRYSAAEYSEVAHSFGELALREYYDVQDLVREDRWGEFDAALAGYIEQRQPALVIKNLLEQHHLLAARRSVLLPALDAYQREELALFASAVAVQIEGIFEDACHLSGVSLHELRGATLVPKLDALLRHSSVKIDYIYYAFKFPKLRNHVAHGRIIESDLSRTCQRLLLDLLDACGVVAGHPGPQNALVSLLKRTAHLSATVRDVLTFAFLYCETSGVPPNAFYSLLDSFHEMRALLEKDCLWKALEQLLALRREEFDSGIRYLANQLKTLRPCLSSGCTRLYSKLGDRGQLAVNRSEFISSIQGVGVLDVPVFSQVELRLTLLSLLSASG